MKKNEDIVNLVLYAVALALGVAITVLSFIRNLDLSTIGTLLGIGVFCLGLAGVRNMDAKKL